MIAHAYTQQQIMKFLQTPAHALGISGETGSGKGFIASHIASELVGALSPYVRSIDALAQKTGIDDIRELQKFLVLTVPGHNTFKRVVVVEHVDALGHEAQNALLKTLEEPPADTIVIVTYSRDTLLLPTIHSRLQRLSVLPIDIATGRKYLPDYPEVEYNRAYHMSGGAVGLLVALLENQGSHPLLAGIQQARELLTLSRFQRLALTDKLVKNDKNPPAIVLDGLYRLMNAGYQQSLHTKSTGELQAHAKRLSLIEQAISDLDQNVQTKLVLSRLFLEL